MRARSPAASSCRATKVSRRCALRTARASSPTDLHRVEGSDRRVRGRGRQGSDRGAGHGGVVAGRSGRDLARGGTIGSTADTRSTEQAVAAVFREEAGRLTAAMVRVLGNFDIAEEVVQDSLVTALETWPRQGIPENPGAWLMTTARRRAI